MKRIELSKQMAGNASCKFSSSSEILKSTFGKFVVVFDNVRIYNSKIDSYSYIQMGSRIFNCEIGKFCSIASNVSIAPGIHDFSKVTTHPALVDKSTPLPKVFAKKVNIVNFKKVFISNDVWIGEKAIVLDGVKIGNGAIVASGAVVVRDVEPYSIVGGVPAKHIKYRFDRETIELFEKSEWWNYSEEWFENNADLMLDTEIFKAYLKDDK
ncbi:CatB-related O-acetyltransferase [Flavobacterium sp. N502540]|uniref:CatB-related O-acetyltransferase n=1 Tax=Flavobacterium sp. N502540 TaxID=2986838 RepID=UPI002224EA2D|nr:CatB-related O-acetyltransferase [Flavobacterium sp. N502540]